MLLETVFTLSLGASVLCANYSREALQSKYPGFGTEWLPMDQDAHGEFVIGYFTKDGADARFDFSPEPSEVVTFTLFTRQHPNGTIIGDSETWKNIDQTKPIKFITHGWMSKGTADSCVTIKDGFLKKYDANVFIVDWSDISGNVFYPIAMAATKGVGEYYAEFLNKLVDLGVEPENIHVVGHSLGAHVSGFAARAVKKGKIGRVTGLDPALPGFNVISLVEGERLSKTDANFVDVIHTCGGFLGMKASIGHADFYPNGGSVPQPGCDNIFEMMEACSHGRSWKYFAASLVETIPFMAFPCDSFENFLHKEDCQDEGVPMGDGTPIDTRGDFYLRTDDEAPFAIKDMKLVLNNRIGSK